MKKIKSIAIIGASRKKLAVGHAILKNLIDMGFPGKIYPVNPKADEILGLKCYSSVKDIPENVDMAVICIPAAAVPQVVEDCGQKGVTFAVVISAGFKEIGPEGAERERLLSRVAKKYKMRILGPNTVGFIDTHAKINATFAANAPHEGNIALASQSGAFCTAILDWSLKSGLGFSQFVALGNKVKDVGITEIDLLLQWKEDPNTKVILFYLEEISDGQQFMKVAREVSQVKPVIVVKSGTSESGARAIASHTGSLAGSDKAYWAAFKQSGVIRAMTAEDLFDYAMAFSLSEFPENDAIAIVTNAGGMGIMAADEVERSGLRLSRFKKETIDTLRKHLPPTAAVLNPVDVIGDATPERYKVAIETVLKDENVAGVVAILSPQAMTAPEDMALVVVELRKKYNKPIIAAFTGGYLMEKAHQLLIKNKVPAYVFPEQAVRAMAALVRYHKLVLDLQRERGIIEHNPVSDDIRIKVREIFTKAAMEHRTQLTEEEAKKIVSLCGIRTPRERLVRSKDEARVAAEEIGFPLAMKIVSPDIPHKTDVGGVILNITSFEELEQAYDSIIVSVSRYVPKARIIGLLVTEMLPPAREIIFGMSRDPQFGPMLMFGLGGIYVEVLKDVTFRIAPITEQQARRMIEEIKTYPLLRGVRGQKAADTDAIVDTLLKLSNLSINFPEIVEMDINPAFVFEKGNGLVALDVKMTLTHEILPH